jgi:hypothetical protein
MVGNNGNTDNINWIRRGSSARHCLPEVSQRAMVVAREVVVQFRLPKVLLLLLQVQASQVTLTPGYANACRLQTQAVRCFAHGKKMVG